MNLQTNEQTALMDKRKSEKYYVPLDMFCIKRPDFLFVDLLGEKNQIKGLGGGGRKKKL